MATSNKGDIFNSTNNVVSSEELLGRCVSPVKSLESTPLPLILNQRFLLARRLGISKSGVPLLIDCFCFRLLVLRESGSMKKDKISELSVLGDKKQKVELVWRSGNAFDL